MHEEREPQNLFGLCFKATDSEFRSILLALYKDPKWTEWGVADYRARLGRFDADTTEGWSLCASLVSLDIEIRDVANRLIEKFLAESDTSY